MSAVLKDELPHFPPEAGVPSVVERIVQRCPARRPEERFQSARDVAFALEALAGRRVVLTTVNKQALEEEVGRTDAIEVRGRHSDMSTIVAAVLTGARGRC